MKKVLVVILSFIVLLGSVSFVSGCNNNVIEVSSYAELVSAIEGNKGTVKLKNDIDVSSAVIINRKVTLDLNGKKLYNSNDIWNDTTKVWSIISVRENGELVVKGNGKIEAKENDCFAFDVKDGANLTIKNGTFIGNIHTVYVFKGEANINGGHYSIKQTYSPDKPYEFTLNCYDANRANETAKIKVKGGEFEKFNPQNCKAEGENTNFVVSGYKSQLKTGTTDIYEVVAE